MLSGLGDVFFVNWRVDMNSKDIVEFMLGNVVVFWSVCILVFCVIIVFKVFVGSSES